MICKNYDLIMLRLYQTTNKKNKIKKKDWCFNFCIT